MAHKLHILALSALLCGVASPAMANEDREQSITVMGENQDFSDGRGSLRSLRLEYKLDLGDTTVVATPIAGERLTPSGNESAIGFGATVYHDFSDSLSTRTQVFVSENEAIFAKLDVAQDFTVRIADKTAATIGGRYARYIGNRDVIFASAGLRRYFRGGNIAYRLTYVDPDNRSGFLSHLASVTVNDGHGDGKTQLWLSAGSASLDRTQIEDTFSGKDYSGMLQRTQPISSNANIILSGGYSSYARPAGRVSSTNLGLGLQFDIK